MAASTGLYPDKPKKTLSLPDKGAVAKPAPPAEQGGHGPGDTLEQVTPGKSHK